MSVHHRMIGIAARIYWRVRKPRTIGVRAILLGENDRIALVRHTYADHWYLPGGGVRKGENIETALLRELEEEIAIKNPRIEEVVGVYHSRREAKDDHIVIFAARAEIGTSADLASVDVIEVEEAGWFPIDRLPVTVSPATARRIAEYRSGKTGWGEW